MKIISVDLGAVRTGLAICDSGGILASPLGVIEEKNFKKLVQKVSEKAKENNAEKIVVGLPVNMDGTKGESAKKSEDFAEMLGKISGIETVLLDERRTTMLANTYLNMTDTTGKKRKNVIDAVSAVIILEDYLKGNFKN